MTERIVYPEISSDHAIRHHFKYRPMQPFQVYGLKVSARPLFELHAFEIIPDLYENGKINGFSFVVSNAGDWSQNSGYRDVRLGVPYTTSYTHLSFSNKLLLSPRALVSSHFCPSFMPMLPPSTSFGDLTAGKKYGPKIMNSARIYLPSTSTTCMI